MKHPGQLSTSPALALQPQEPDLLRDPAEPGQAATAVRTETDTHGLWILAILSMLMAFASISTDLYLPAMPVMGAALHATESTIQLTVSGYLIGFSLGQLFWGPISDRYGRRIPVAIGLVLFIIGSAGCALSTSGNMMTVMAIAPLVGPSVGGQILHWFSWRAIFWTLVAVGLLTLPSLLLLPETLPREHRRVQSPLGVLVRYGGLLANRRFLGYAATGGFFYAGTFAYIAGSSFAYISYYHMLPRFYACCLLQASSE